MPAPKADCPYAMPRPRKAERSTDLIHTVRGVRAGAALCPLLVDHGVNVFTDRPAHVRHPVVRSGVGLNAAVVGVGGVDVCAVLKPVKTNRVILLMSVMRSNLKDSQGHFTDDR